MFLDQSTALAESVEVVSPPVQKGQHEQHQGQHEYRHDRPGPDSRMGPVRTDLQTRAEE